ncbi:MAG: GntR family transcriptional regulator [Betaproteobacteria bacterium]|nr:GntR family transcriptional regulator [Betaproteobacteria bacterium]
MTTLTGASEIATPAADADQRLLHETVGQRLRDMIVQGELAPETKLNERVLAEQLGISRTPLREAIRYLASEGLVELLPNRGAMVAALKPEKVKEIFAVMGALEALAGELACANASDADIVEIRALHYEMLAHHARGDLANYFRCNQAIHMKLLECTGNGTLADVYRGLNAHARRARYIANLSRERWDSAVREHEDILAALVARDGARLKTLLRDHLAHKLTMAMEALGAEVRSN